MANTPRKTDRVARSDSIVGAFDNEGRLLRDAQCPRCGYNLRGLKRDGTCPECGTPVKNVLQGAGLSFSAPVWLRRLHGGLVLLEVSFGMLLIAPFSLWLFLLLDFEAVPGRGGLAACLGIGTLGLCLAAALAAFVGLILVTQAEPKLVPTAPRWTARRTTRCAALGLALAIVVSSIGWEVGGRGAGSAIALKFILGSLIPMLFVVLGLSYSWYVSGLLRRSALPEVQRSRPAFWVLVVFLVSSCCYGAALMASVRYESAAAVVGVLFLAEILAGLASLVALFAVTRRTRQALRNVLRIA